MKAMILAAGLGTRLRPITDQLAKPAVPFLNVPLLYYPLSLLEHVELDGVVVNTHHKPEQIRELVEKRPWKSWPFEITHEPGLPLGSGGGIWNARSHLKGHDVLVCNGDEVILPHDETTVGRFVDKHRSEAAYATILVMRHPLVGTQFGGVWVDNDGRVHGFGKDRSKFAAHLEGRHYIGLLLLSPRALEDLPEGESNILYDTLTAGIARGEKVQAVTAEFDWWETGNPKDFVHATGEALKILVTGNDTRAAHLRALAKKVWQSGSRIEKREDATVIFGKESRIAGNAKIKGFVVLGNHAKIEDGAYAEDCVVLDHASLETSERAINQIVINK